MKIICHIMLSTLRRTPVRTILAACAMIAAASIVSWLVAGYDAMFDDFAQDQKYIGKQFDAILTISADSPELDPVTVTKILADPAVKISRVYTGETRVNTTTNRAKVAEAAQNNGTQPRRGGGMGGPGGRPGGGGSRGGRGGMGGGNLSPVVYGLPTGGGIALQGTDAEIPPFPLENGMWLPKIDLFEDGESPISEAVLSASISKQTGYSTGDVMTVASNAGYFQLKIVGVMEDGPNIRSLAKLSTRHPNAVMTGCYGIFTSWETAEKIAGGRRSAATIQLSFLSEDVAKEFAERWGRELDLQGAVYATSSEIDKVLSAPDPGRTGSMAQAYSATGLSMLASFFIIFATLSMGIDERLRQFAMLRLLALTRKQVAMMILLESLLLGLVGWGGGLLSGWFLQMILSASKDINMSFRIGWRTILLTGACSVLGATGAAVWPMIRAMRIRPIDALAPLSRSMPKRISIRAAVVGFILLFADPLIASLHGLSDMAQVLLYSIVGVPALAIGFVLLSPFLVDVCGRIFLTPLAMLFRLHPLFAKSQFAANRWRIVGSVVSLSVGLGFYMMLVICTSSMLVPYVPGDWMPDLFLAVTPGGVNEATAALVNEIPGVNPNQCLPIAVEQVLLGSDVTNSAERESVVRQNNVVLLGVEPEPAYIGKNALFPFRFLTDKDKALAMMEENPYTCLLPHYFINVATNPDTGKRYEIGDEFEVITPGIKGKTVRFKVAGIIEQFGWHWFSKMSGTRRNQGRTSAMVFTTRKAMMDGFGLERCEYFWMNLQRGADPQSIADELANLAATNAGESFRVAGMNGLSTVGRQSVRMTTKTGLYDSLISRADMIIDGMLKMPLLILLVITISVANTALASIRARRLEIGMMRAVALSASQLFRLVLLEAVLITITATLISFSFGIISGLCSAQMAAHSQFFGGMGWTFAIAWDRTFIGLGITAGLCIVVALVPAVIAGRSKPLKLIQDGSSNL